MSVFGVLVGGCPHAKGQERDAYSYASKCARQHILAQGKIGRESLIAISQQVSKGTESIYEGRRVRSYSYSSTGSPVGCAIEAAATDPPPKGFDCRSRMTASLQLSAERGWSWNRL